MDPTADQFAIAEGSDVLGADGGKVGKVTSVQPGHIVVAKGLFFPTDYSIPISAVASADERHVYLNLTKDEALARGWDAEPTADTDADAATTTTTADGEAATAGMGSLATGDDALAGGGSHAGLTEDNVPFEHYEDSDRTHLDLERGVVVPVHEEELAASTRERQIGQVQIEKEVVAEERVLDVPVTEERIRVQRHAVDRPAAPGEDLFEEGLISVPVRGEEVQLQKQVRVAEEVEIGKETVQRTERVSGTVRHEEVRVEEQIDYPGESVPEASTAESGEGTKRKRRKR